MWPEFRVPVAGCAVVSGSTLNISAKPRDLAEASAACNVGNGPCQLQNGFQIFFRHTDRGVQPDAPLARVEDNRANGRHAVGVGREFQDFL